MSASLKKNYICGFRCVIFAVLVVSLRSIHDVINLKFFYINVGYHNDVIVQLCISDICGGNTNMVDDWQWY